MAIAALVYSLVWPASGFFKDFRLDATVDGYNVQ